MAKRLDLGEDLTFVGGDGADAGTAKDGALVAEHRDATTLQRLSSDVALSPSLWLQEEAYDTPRIWREDIPVGSLTAYVPAPIILPNGDIWVYVKGEDPYNIYGFKSTDGGETLTYEGIALEPGTGVNSWDLNYASEPFAIYDEDSDTIHMWYKGSRDSVTGASIGYATAPGSTPLAFTKWPNADPDLEGQILAEGTVRSALGFGSMLNDLAFSDVIRGDDGTIYFYGYFATEYGTNPGESDYRIFLATGTSYHEPVTHSIILEPEAGYELAYVPTVFKHPAADVWLMIYTRGVEMNGPIYHLACAWSTDRITWTKFDDWFKLPLGWLTSPAFPGREFRIYAGSVLKQPRGNFDELQFVNGRALMYYSKSPQDTFGDSTWLLRLLPGVGRVREAAAMPRLRLARSTAQSIPSGTPTNIRWQVTEYSTPADLAFQDPGFGAYEIITCRTPGTYRIQAGGSFAANATGSRVMDIVVNSATPGGMVAPGHASVSTHLQADATVYLESGDTVRVRVSQDSGSALDLGGDYLPKFDFYRIA